MHVSPVGASSCVEDLAERSLLTNKCPVNSDDTLVRKSFQRFGKNEISRAFSLSETYDPELYSILALLYRHDPIVFHSRLEMMVGFRLLPKRVDLWFATFFHHLRKRCRLNFEELHSRMVRPGPAVAPNKKVRQRTTARRIRLPLLHSCPGGVCKSSIHSPWRRMNFHARSRACNPI